MAVMKNNDSADERWIPTYRTVTSMTSVIVVGEKMTMINDMSGMNSYIYNSTSCNNEESCKIINNFNNASVNRQEKKEECVIQISSLQNNINELHSALSFNEIDNEKSNYIKKIFEIKDKCQSWIDKYHELHEKYLSLESKCILVEEENCNYQVEIANIKIIKDENLRLNQTADKSNRVCKELESALESCHEIIYKYQNEVEVTRNKVIEAVNMVENTRSEKQRIATDLNNSKEEIVKLENEIKKLIPDADVKVNLEVEKMKTMYKDKLRIANVDMKFLRTENQIACNITQKMSREYDILNKKYTSINEKCMNKPNVYSKKVALLIKQIEEYEVAFKSLTSNIDILKDTNRKLQDSHARKINKYIMEITFLTNTVNSLETHLNRATNEITEYNINNIEAINKVKSLEKEISKLKQRECNFEQKNMQIDGLTKYVETNKNMIDMWRREMNDMIEGFKHKFYQLKKHCSIMNKENIKLKRIIHNSKSNCSKRNKIPRLQKNKRSYISSMSTSSA